MSYPLVEASIALGRPYYLYAFDDGTTVTRYSSEPIDISWGADTFLESPIEHSDIEQSGNIEKASLELKFPISHEFARRFLAPIAQVVTMTVWRFHHSDDTKTPRVIWKGRVVGAKSQGERIILEVESVFTSMRRPGCRARYQRTCRFALYSDGCNLDINAFKSAATITAINGLVLTVPAAASAPVGDFKAGIVIYNGTYGFISNHVGSSLTLLAPMPGLQTAFDNLGSLDVFLAPGCDLSLTRCHDRFSNSDNNGGFPFMPDHNPFSISIM